MKRIAGGLARYPLSPNWPACGATRGYLRSGHVDPLFTIESLRAILNADPDVTPPFILVAKRTDGYVTIRIRQST